MKLTSWARSVGAQPRVLLAAKTAFAASLAWLLAPLIPLADADYSYYAPLGAVVSMYPTLVRSARTGLQALVGLALGAGIAFVTLGLGVPRVAGIAIVVGVGVLLAGVRFLGEGRNWVPITGLFVLLIGGVNADDYSINYLVHMVLGVIVGVLVTVLIAPPLYLQRADVRLNRLRDQVADHLRDLATALRDGSTSERDWRPTWPRWRTPQSTCAARWPKPTRAGAATPADDRPRIRTTTTIGGCGRWSGPCSMYGT